MSIEFTYFRKYIILKNNYTNISNINPKGHGKIEIRGNRGTINLNVENGEVERDYRVYLLKDKNGRVHEYDVGRIITDEQGRTRTNITLNLRELESKGFSIDKIDAILIRKGIYVLLGGYIDEDNGTIDRLIKKLALEEEKDIPVQSEPIEQQPIVETEEIKEIEETEEIEEVGVVEEPEPIEPENIQETEEKDDHEEEIEVEIEEQKSQDDEIIQIEEYEEETILEEVESIEEVFDEPIRKEEHESYQSLEYIRRLNHKNQMTNYILSILRFFPYVQPLRMHLHGYNWWRIEDDGTDSYKGFLPYYNYLMSMDYKYPFISNSTTCLNLIKKYGHYLFGMYKQGKETKYYIYAVPGKFTVGEHPFKGITGFNTWYESINGTGYWVLYIDPITGKVIYPLNPMVPAY